MTATIAAVLLGATAMASFVATLFFFRFWRQTRDSFFLLFSLAFGLEGISRVALALSHPSDETEPLFYVTRLVTFGLIIAAVIAKNRPARRDP